MSILHEEKMSALHVILGDTLSFFRTVRSFERMSRRPTHVSPSFALLWAFPTSPPCDNPGLKPATGPDVGATWRGGGYSRNDTELLVWYAVWYITFSPEPNVVLNSIYACQNNPVPEVQSQNDCLCQIVPNKTRP